MECYMTGLAKSSEEVHIRGEEKAKNVVKQPFLSKELKLKSFK